VVSVVSGVRSGEKVAARLRVINHDARDESMLTWCGVHGDGCRSG